MYTTAVTLEAGQGAGYSFLYHAIQNATNQNTAVYNR